jgi:TolB-like protein/class 3 adenylate cyclase
MGPQERQERRLVAIFAADVAGYSRLMSQDEGGTLRTLTARRAILDRFISVHAGRIANTAGDSVLAEFTSVVDAIQCAVAAQEALAVAGQNLPESQQLRFRIGVHVGDVIVQGGDLFGDGVNIAARLQSIAEAGGVCVSGAAHDYVRKALLLSYVDRGPQQVKNIDEPVRAYFVTSLDAPSPGLTPIGGRSAALSHSEKPSIAVLPFENFSGNPDDDYFSDGITEDLITALTRVRWFHVIARNSVFGYKKRNQDIRQIARDLGARYVLEGSVRKAQDQVRLTAQLIDGATGTHLWAKRYDRELTDIFAVQDDLTECIVASVEPELGKAERERALAKRPENLTAWDLCQRGLWHLYRRHKDNLVEAERLFGLALDLDPELLPAIIGSAEANYFAVAYGYADDPTKPHQQVALRLAQRAVELDDQDPAARCTMARALLLHNEHEAAIPHIEAALALNPSMAWAHYLLGVAYAYSGRAEDALAPLGTAISLSPHDPYAGRIMVCRAEAHLFLGQYEQAAEWARRALREPSTIHWSGHSALVSALGYLGRKEDAGRAMRDLLLSRPDFTSALLGRSLAIRDPQYLACYREGLYRAGLHE